MASPIAVAGINLCLAIDMSGSVCSPDLNNPQLCTDCPTECNSNEFCLDVCCVNFQNLLRFSQDVINDVDVDSNMASQFSAVSFSDSATLVTGLTDAATADSAIWAIDYAGGLRNHAAAIEACQNTFAGDTSGNQNVILLVTDGVADRGGPDPQASGIAAATAALTAGTFISPVLIRGNPSTDDIDYITSLSTDGVITTNEDFDDLSSIVVDVADIVESAELPSSMPSSSIWPSEAPSASGQPSENPSVSNGPTSQPSFQPSGQPSENPSASIWPSGQPSENPSASFQPSGQPSMTPSASIWPSGQPSENPSASDRPTSQPTENPSASFQPSGQPSMNPSASIWPSGQPSENPSASDRPTPLSSGVPSLSGFPSSSSAPIGQPSENPSVSQLPSMNPSVSRLPSSMPTSSILPTEVPSSAPIGQPSENPSVSQLPSMNPSVSSMPSVKPPPGCPRDYHPGVSYEPNDVVRARDGLVYKCAADPSSQYCGANGFEPGLSLYWTSAWTMVGPCKGSITPTVAPNFVDLPNLGGCPGEFESYEKYDAGDRVSQGGLVYSCNDWPRSQHCSQDGYEPGNPTENPPLVNVWQDAWTLIGYCSGTISPTTSPSFDKIPDLGGCPKKFEQEAPYVAGDRVSQGGLVYECNSWPRFAHCSQHGYSPGNPTNNPPLVNVWQDAWTLIGYCSGTISPTTSPSFDKIPDLGGCPKKFEQEAPYDAGDRVSQGGLVYECNSWPRSAHCSQHGYSPGNPTKNPPLVNVWQEAWTLIGFCSGTIAPSTSPNFDKLPDLGGCPEPWERRITANAYQEGDRVSADGLVLQCKPWPASGWCSQDGYEPLTNPATPDAWKQAWDVLGHCSGTIAPSVSPNYIVLPPVGGCPEEWEVGGDYEEGDRVSANGLVFECKAWPFGAHCPQAGYRPLGSTRYPELWMLSWKTIGHCEGTIAPSTSPVAPPGSPPCPEEWSPNGPYEEGDYVAVTVSAEPLRQVAYQCKSWPSAAFCQLHNPTEENVGSIGWVTIGSCNPECSDDYVPAKNYPTGSKVSCDGINYECTAVTGCAVGDVSGVSPNWTAVSSCADSEIMLSNRIY